MRGNWIFLDFKASTGWLDSFKSPFNIGHFKISGESADVNIPEIEKYKETPKEKLKTMKPRTCLIVTKPVFFSRALPEKSFALKGFECKGGKLAKERITVMVACSIYGR